MSNVIVMQLRYAFRLYPDPGQQRALARAFGCARVVFNDAVRAREDARKAEQPLPKAAELSTRLITQAKRTAERSWLGEVSAVVLQQSLRDVEGAYRNFFASLKGARKGPKVGAPRFKSRKDARQSIRFTANARWNLTDSGRLNLPKIGPVKVKWSRTLPTTPTSVTVIKDAAGRFFASFVIDTDPATDAARMPETDRTIGIDLGLTHFAVLSDGTKIDSPRFLRRAEKKLKKAQRELSRTQKGSKNREKARLTVARAHAQVTDARREFHHQLSTRLISENQGIAVEDLSGGTGPHQAGQVRARRRMVLVREHAGIQGGKIRADSGGDRPVRADLPDLLHLRRQGRTQAPRCPGVDVCRLRHGPRPGPQCRDQCEDGRRTGGIGLRSAGKTGSNPGTA
ncbi:transposase [Streptomyces sp. V4I2]|nr:transposase [Streptomyces sp. V4I2]